MPGAPPARLVSARLAIAEIHAAHGRSAAAEDFLAAAARDAAQAEDGVLLSQVHRLGARFAVRSHPDKALVLLDRARVLLEGRPHELSHVLGEIGEAHQRLGELVLARRRHRESLAGCLALRDQVGVALAHLNLALVAWAEGDGAAALRRIERCERRARRLGHSALVARALYHAGVIEGRLGRLSNGIRRLTHCAVVMRQVEDEPGHCDALAQLAAVHHAAGRHELARTLIEDVIARRGRLNDLRGVAAARVTLGRILTVTGALDDAETLLRTAADAAEQLELGGIAVDALGGLAEVAVRRGRPDEAAALLERQRKAAAGVGPAALASSELVRIEIACETDLAGARVMLGRLMRSARGSRDAAVLAEARRLSGLARSGASAIASLQAASRFADRSGFRELSWKARADLGSRLLREGDAPRALEVMKEAMTVLRSIYDELPSRKREAYLADPRKQRLRAMFADAVDRVGVPAA
jgi:tetratricopeptide (TPR) repeat protein